MKNDIKAVAEKVNDYLSQNVISKDSDLSLLYDSMRYSLLDSGKRIRPYIVISVARALGASDEAAIPFAAALEMIHTYSLIHDDLPCMDDDDFRRGRPSNHKAFGEDIALLAGDALLTKAFETVSFSCASSETKIEAIKALSVAAGADGMIGGQLLDLDAEKNPPSIQALLKIYSMKTGALLRAAAQLGYLASKNKSEEISHALDVYATNIGTSFQIVDDVLDKYGNAEDLGKPIGSDEKNGKVTFVSFYSREEALDIAAKMTHEAICAIKNLPQSDNLVKLAKYLLERNV
jgi:geranylgeranyl pyrophosphate synthase